MKKNNTEYLLSLLHTCLGDNLDYKYVQSCLCKYLKIRKNRFVTRLNKWKYVWKSGPGTNGISAELRQSIFELWLEKSIISVDRRDGRDVVTISNKKYGNLYQGINCPNVKAERNK